MSWLRRLPMWQHIIVPQDFPKRRPDSFVLISTVYTSDSIFSNDSVRLVFWVTVMAGSIRATVLKGRQPETLGKRLRYHDAYFNDEPM